MSDFEKVRQMCEQVKTMPVPVIFAWAKELYTQGYNDGYRDGGHEFDDAIIMTEDEARKRGMQI